MNRRDLFKAVAALPFVALGVKATSTLNEAIAQACANVYDACVTVTPEQMQRLTSLRMVAPGIYYYKWTWDERNG